MAEVGNDRKRKIQFYLRIINIVIVVGFGAFLVYYLLNQVEISDIKDAFLGMYRPTLIAALAITGFIGLGAATATVQVLNRSAKNSDYTTASRHTIRSRRIRYTTAAVHPHRPHPQPVATWRRFEHAGRRRRPAATARPS